MFEVYCRRKMKKRESSLSTADITTTFTSTTTRVFSAAHRSRKAAALGPTGAVSIQRTATGNGTRHLKRVHGKGILFFGIFCSWMIWSEFIVTFMVACFSGMLVPTFLYIAVHRDCGDRNRCLYIHFVGGVFSRHSPDLLFDAKLSADCRCPSP